MGKKLALVNKIKRRRKKVRNDASSFDRANKMDRMEETMGESQKAYQVMRKIARRSDRNFGVDAINQEPAISKRNNALTVERFDYGGSDFGTRMTMAAGLIADMGVRPNDIVMPLEGLLKGHYLKVVAVTDSTHLRLEDSSALNDPGKKELTKVTCIADVAGSLNNDYFLIKSAGDAISYYVWYNVNAAGVDPAPGGTGIEVAVATNATAAQVAAATQAAVDAEADFAASLGVAGTGEVYIENAAVGATTDAAAGTSGFGILVVRQGSDADATVSESNIMARFQLSDVKASYR